MAGTFWPVTYWAPRYFEARYFGAGGTSSGGDVVATLAGGAVLTGSITATGVLGATIAGLGALSGGIGGRGVLQAALAGQSAFTGSLVDGSGLTPVLVVSVRGSEGGVSRARYGGVPVSRPQRVRNMIQRPRDFR